MKRTATALLTASVLLLGACGTAPASPTAGTPSVPGASAGAATGPSVSSGFNDADVMFLQMMVPHHGQGVNIVKLARNHRVGDDVKTLAAAIEVTQAAEAADMAGWLKAWKKPPTAPASAHAAHGGMPGTTAAEIYKLDKTDDSEFERKFLQMLIAHQDDAIQIARTESVSGVNQKARDLAKRIDISRTAQITQLRAQLGE